MAPRTADATPDISGVLSVSKNISKTNMGIYVIKNEGIEHGIKMYLPLIFTFSYLSNVNISTKFFHNYIFTFKDIVFFLDT